MDLDKRKIYSESITHNFSSRSMTVIFFLMIGILISSPLWASNLIVNVQGNKIDVYAEKTPLIDILAEVADRTDVILRTGDPLEIPVSIQLKSISIEQCFRRLLANQNYSILYKKTETNDFVPMEVRIFGKESLKRMNPGAIAQKIASAPPPPDTMKRYSNEWYEQQFGNTKKLLREISADSGGDKPDKRGIQIKKISTGSVFNEIGLATGDIILDVDGHPVETVEEFINILHDANKEKTGLRIAREKKGNIMDPIYIEINKSDNQNP